MRVEPTDLAHNGAMEYAVIRLQVQRSPLKPGTAPHRWYDPSPLAEVVSLDLDDDGGIGVTDGGEHVIDVHNRTHPQTRDAKGRGGISVMGTGDYVALRDRYGPHLLDGIAGESVLVDAPDGLAGRELPETIVIRTAAGSVDLQGFRVAEPCVEFTRFCLRREPDEPVDQQIKDHLALLDGGARGYKARVTVPGTIRIGDLLAVPG